MSFIVHEPRFDTLVPAVRKLRAPEYLGYVPRCGEAYKNIGNMAIIQVNAGYGVVNELLRATITDNPYHEISIERLDGRPLQVERYCEKPTQWLPVFSHPLKALVLEQCEIETYRARLIPAGDTAAEDPITVLDKQGFEKMVEVTANALEAIQAHKSNNLI